jgi:hypothetical protein
MTTVLTVVTQALVDSGVLDDGEAASAAEAQRVLGLFNQMLALWSIDNVNVYAQQETSFSPDGAVSYTVGSGADVNMTRPARIDRAFWRSSGIDYPIAILDTFEQWESIEQKTQAGEPMYAFYLPSYATGTLFLYPQPSTGAVHLVSNVALPTDSALADTLSLPPEYILPIRTNLTLLVAGSYGAPVRPAIAAAAASSLRLLRRNNLRIQPLTMPGAIPVSISRGNIIGGD